MACDLTLGRKVPCKDVVGGLVRVWFVNFGTLGTITESNDEITDMTGTFTAFQYDLKGTNNLDQSITSSRENGTTFTEQTLTLTLPKMTKEFHKEFKLMAYGRPHVCVEDNNGNFWQCGRTNGMEITTIAVSSGTAMGDLSGYTLTMVGQELAPANFIASATAADPYAGMSSATVTVTVGTNS
jgi:hypothetical protein|tara:strand:+ start:454 stop:1002 length:549 start_codon:yes stop_codon:yes gene_type:complete